MGESSSLGDLVGAELAPLELRDRELVARLCAAVEAAATARGIAAGRVPPDVGGAVVLAVLDEIRAAGPDDETASRLAELESAQTRLAQLQADPDNVENLSFRDLARRLVRGRRAEK